MRSSRRLLDVALISAALALAIVALCAGPAYAGQASSGKLLFYPCTSCHPVDEIPGTEKANRPLPGGFQGHSIVLEGHDKLGAGHGACPVCHDVMTRNPGMLKAIDGSLIDIKTGDLSLVCYRCHSAKYKEFKAGTHGKPFPSCVSRGCHDPHTPGFIYAPELMPFTGTGFQFQVLSHREPFTPLAAPAPAPAVTTPWWLFAVGVVGLAVAGGLVGMLVSGRFKR
jgi:hypothetical protein